MVFSSNVQLGSQAQANGEKEWKPDPLRSPEYQGEIMKPLKYYRIPKSISDTKKPKDTFIGAYTLEKYEGLSRKKLMVS